MPRPLVPTTTTRLHHRTRHRVLELERRMVQAPAPFDFMVVACAISVTTGASGRWYVVQSGCKLGGLVATLENDAGITTTGTVAVNGATVVTATIAAGSSQAVVGVDPVPLGPDDYLTFGCSSVTALTLQALCTGRGAYSGGLAMYEA